MGSVPLKKVLILGVNGFIGHHLAFRILKDTEWHVYGMDLYDYRLTEIFHHKRFNFIKQDISKNSLQVDEFIKYCDIIVPLVAIATPGIYIKNPIKVFELDFEENLKIVRSTVKYKKRLVFPSSSEVYGLSLDNVFDPETSSLIYGPISKTRWIYACSKQLLDRVIHAYGEECGLRFTIFRPFNWIGTGLDSIDKKENGSSRVVSQFVGHITRGETIYLVGGGHQTRCFTDIRDGIDALMLILEDKFNVSDGNIYNIGNPENEITIHELALRMLSIAGTFPKLAGFTKSVEIMSADGKDYYGEGYQDIERRVPCISLLQRDFGWRPRINIDDSLINIFRAVVKG